MSIIAPSAYAAPDFYRNSLLATTLPTLLRRVPPFPWIRQRMNTQDGDFIDLDCWWQKSQQTALLCHGLEGNAHRSYMLGMAQALGIRGWNVVGYNYRGCSGETNHQLHSYHSGATADLQEVLLHLNSQQHPVTALVGFSLGGNLILKYLGENPGSVLPTIGAAVAISAPVDLAETTRQLERRRNCLYNRRFLRKLKDKIRDKGEMFPDKINHSRLREIKTLRDFDHAYTAPFNGFQSAEDYYRKCSANQFLSEIRVPSLLISALDDPFLGPNSYPNLAAGSSDFFHLETPKNGGHVGFFLRGGEYWSEKRATEFIREHTQHE